MTSPFDPALSAAPTRCVSVRRVVDLLNVTHAPERIESYREAMCAGDRFPPISVVRLGGRYVVADGHKRLSAAKALGEERIDVEIWSIWRLTRNLAGQSARHAAAAGRALGGVFRGADGRRDSWHFVTATVAHWRRTGRSLWRIIAGGRDGETGA